MRGTDPPSFNKREDEFAELKDYNDYLETVENISASPGRVPR